MEPGWPTNPKQGVLDACETLHMLANGSLDGITLADSDMLAAWLSDKLDAWRATTSTYDGLVKALAEIALGEYRASRDAALQHYRDRKDPVCEETSP